MKLYYTITEVCDELGCSSSKIRYYEYEFGLPIKRISRGVRRYTQADISRLKTLVQMEGLGLSIKLLKKVQKDDVAMELVQMLRRRLDL